MWTPAKRILIDLFHSQEQGGKYLSSHLISTHQAKRLINRPQRMKLFWTRHSANTHYNIKIYIKLKKKVCIKLSKVETYSTFHWKEEESNILKGLGPALQSLGNFLLSQHLWFSYLSSLLAKPSVETLRLCVGNHSCECDTHSLHFPYAEIILLHRFDLLREIR